MEDNLNLKSLRRKKKIKCDLGKEKKANNVASGRQSGVGLAQFYLIRRKIIQLTDGIQWVQEQ